MREIRIAGEPSGAAQGVPAQTEALAHFARMTTPPSLAFRTALNRAIWRWKSVGAWVHVKGLWIHAADTHQAALLSVNGDTPRDAVVVGAAPTFTPLKGHSGFDATHGLKWPITSTILASDSVYAFAAGKLDASEGGIMIRSDATLGVPDLHVPGHLNYTGEVRGGWSNQSIVHTASPTSYFIGGTRENVVISPAGITSGSGTSNPRSSNYRTTADDANPLGLISAYGFLAAAASQAVCRKFITVLAEMLNELGAFD